MKVIVTAKFKGTADFIGYIPGKEYVLMVQTSLFPLYFAFYIYDYTDGTKKCAYTSFKTLMRNWENLTVIKEN